MVALFAPLLESEERLAIHPDGFDVVLERTWTGRDIATLVTCLSGLNKLNVKKKVAFRVVCRLADIIEGWPDLPDARKDLGLRVSIRNINVLQAAASQGFAGLWLSFCCYLDPPACIGFL